MYLHFLVAQKMAKTSNKVMIVGHDVGHWHPLHKCIERGQDRLTHLAVTQPDVLSGVRQVSLIVSLQQRQQEAKDVLHLRDKPLVDLFTSLILFQGLKNCDIFDDPEHHKHDQLSLSLAFAAENLQFGQKVWPLLRPLTFYDFDDNS